MSNDKVAKLCRSDPGLTRDKNDKIVCEFCPNFKYYYRSLDGKSKVKQHLNTLGHKKALAQLANNKKPDRQAKVSILFDKCSKKTNDQQKFNEELTQMLVHCDIPFHKINNPAFKKFISKFTDFNCPDESHLRKNYVDNLHKETIKKIQDEIGQSPIYLIIDETTDALQRYVCNVLVGKLDGKHSKAMLISSEELKATNNTTVIQAVNNACRILWPSDVYSSHPYDRLQLLVSDQASYMLKAGRNLKKAYPSMKHITCLAHALNLVAEEARASLGMANQLVSAMKTIFSKCVRRRILFKEITKLPLPPKVVITRWGTWIIAAMFYNEHYDAIKAFIDKLHFGESEACTLLKKIYTNKKLRDELLEAPKLKFIIDGIKKLQDPNLSSSQQIEIVETVRSKLTGNLKVKLDESLGKNPDYEGFNSFDGQLQSTINNQVEAPLVSVEAERSFSKHKSILKPNRESFTFENLSKYSIINFNAFLFQE